MKLIGLEAQLAAIRIEEHKLAQYQFTRGMYSKYSVGEAYR